MLDSTTVEAENDFELQARNEWKKRETAGFSSMYSKRKKKDAPKVSKDLIGKRVEYLAEFDMDDNGTEKEPRWCSGVVERICDGTWVIPGRMRKCWNENEAVEVFWDAVPEADAPACRAQVALDPKKWNKDGIGAWRMVLGEYNYGV